MVIISALRWNNFTVATIISYSCIALFVQWKMMGVFAVSSNGKMVWKRFRAQILKIKQNAS